MNIVFQLKEITKLESGAAQWVEHLM